MTFVFSAVFTIASTAENLCTLRIVVTRNYQHHILERNFINGYYNGYSLQRVATYIREHRADSNCRVYAINIGLNADREYRITSVENKIFETVDSIVTFDKINRLPYDAIKIISSEKVQNAINQLDSTNYEDKFLVIRKFGEKFDILYLSAKDYAPAKGFEKISTMVENFISRNFSITNKRSISARSILSGSSDFLNSAHRYQLSTTNADISISSANSIEDSISSNMNIKHLNKLFPYDNQLVTFSISEKQLLKLLENTANDIYQRMFSRDDDILKITPEGNLLQATHNIDCFGGLFWSIDVRRKNLRVEIDSLSNRKVFRLDDNYKVVTNSFRAKKIVSELGLHCKIEVVENDWFTGYIKWLNTNHNTTIDSEIGRLHINPKSWTRESFKRELPIIRDRQSRRHQKRNSPL